MENNLPRAELAALLRLAAPLMLAQLTQMGMGVADAVMAGHVSATDLAGVTLGGNAYWPVLMLVSGVIMALTPTIAQLHGAGRQDAVGEVVRQGLWLALAGGILMVIFLNTIWPLYHWLGVDARAIPVARAYQHALSWGVMASLGFFCLRYLCEGMSWTKPSMFIAFTALPAKIALNYVFINGLFGLPAMGGAGCGWSSAVVGWGQLTAMASIVAFSRLKSVGVFARFSAPDPGQLGRLIRLGVPIGLSTFLEMAVFSFTTLLIGRISVEAVAAHQIAMNVGGLTFMLPMGVGMAAAIRVGYNVGAGDLSAARRSGWLAIGVAAGFAIFAAALVLLARAWIAAQYTPDVAVQALAVQLMFYVAVFQLFDDTQTTAIGSLRGFKDTRTPMWVALFAYWGVGFPVAAVLGLGLAGFPELGLEGFWIGLTVGLGVASVALVTRYRGLSRDAERIRRLAG